MGETKARGAKRVEPDRRERAGHVRISSLAENPQGRGAAGCPGSEMAGGSDRAGLLDLSGGGGGGAEFVEIIGSALRMAT